MTRPLSAARVELERRRQRSPREVAQLLARHYGREFDQPWYIGALPLVARIRLGEVADVQRLVEPWLDGTRDSLARPNALVMAGHIVFTELARHTRDPRHAALVRRVADLGFDAAGQMLEAMPFHDRYSDSVFMGTTILAQAGALTGERRYFDMADRHLALHAAPGAAARWPVPPPLGCGCRLGPWQWLRRDRAGPDVIGTAAQLRRDTRTRCAATANS